MARYNIYYCDDEDFFIDRFKKRHPHYDVSQFCSSDELFEKLKDTEHVPDLILLDLYFPKDAERDGYAELEQSAQEALDKLNQDLEAIKSAVEKVREPLGVEVLEHLRDSQRKEVREIPVAIYTRRGMLILDDEPIRAVAKHGGLWMLKNSKTGPEQISKETETIWIENMINRAIKSPPITAEEIKKIPPLEFLRRLTSGTIAMLTAFVLGAYAFGVATAGLLN